MKKRNAMSLFLALLAVLFVTAGMTTVEAAARVGLNKKSITIKQQQECTLKLKGAKKNNVKWSSSDKKIASVKKGVVKGKKAGKCVITAKYNGRKYTCKVTVKIKNPKKYDASVMLFQGNTGLGEKSGITVLRTKKQLNTYLKKLEKKTDGINVKEKKFLKLLGQYDESYFKAHSLIIVLQAEPSSSTDVKYNGIVSQDGKYVISLTRETPEIQNQMMAFWHILIETDNKAISKANVTVLAETAE